MNKRTTIFLSDRQIDLLKEESSRLQMTLAELLRRLIDAHFDKREKRK